MTQSITILHHMDGIRWHCDWNPSHVDGWTYYATSAMLFGMTRHQISSTDISSTTLTIIHNPNLLFILKLITSSPNWNVLFSCADCNAAQCFQIHAFVHSRTFIHLHLGDALAGCPVCDSMLVCVRICVCTLTERHSIFIHPKQQIELN